MGAPTRSDYQYALKTSQRQWKHAHASGILSRALPAHIDVWLFRQYSCQVKDLVPVDGDLSTY